MEKTIIHTPKDEKIGSVLARAATVMKGNNRLLKEVATPQVKNEIVEEVLRRQKTPPGPTLRETIKSDLDALKNSGLVSQFFNKSVKVVTPLRSQRSPEPPPVVEEEDDFVTAKSMEEISNVDVMVTVDIPESTAPSDTCQELGYSREPASNV